MLSRHACAQNAIRNLDVPCAQMFSVASPCHFQMFHPVPYPQVRDEFRLDYDEGRGGYGIQVKQMELAAEIHGLTGLGMEEMAAPMFFGPGQRAGLQLAAAPGVLGMEGEVEELYEEQQQQVMQEKNPRFREEEEDEDDEDEGGRRRRRRRVEGLAEGEELELEVVQEGDLDAPMGGDDGDAAQQGDGGEDAAEEEEGGEEQEMGDEGAGEAAAAAEDSIEDVAAEEDGT